MFHTRLAAHHTRTLTAHTLCHTLRPTCFSHTRCFSQLIRTQQQQQQQQHDHNHQQQQNALSPIHGLSHYREPRFYEGMLTREFINVSLYNHGSGYFNVEDRIHQNPNIDFSSIKNRSHWYHHLHNLYHWMDQSWLTPVELFKPEYARAIARWILDTRVGDLKKIQQPHKVHTVTEAETVAEVFPSSLQSQSQSHSQQQHSQQQQEQQQQHNSSAAGIDSEYTTTAPHSSQTTRGLYPLYIMEIGAGNGTCCQGILDFLQEQHPELYAVTQYTIVELSSTLVKQQHRTLKPHIDAGKVKIEQMNAVDWKQYTSEYVYVIGLEVLDNMAHDKLYQDDTDKAWYQTHVFSKPRAVGDEFLYSQYFFEEVALLQDPLSREYMELTEDYVEPKDKTKTGSFDSWTARGLTKFLRFARESLHSETQMYIPTTCLQFLKMLHAYVPNHHVLLADFDMLPTKIHGINAPVVSAKSKHIKGRVHDFDHYLVELGTADIFFPTDFFALQHVYHKITGRTNSEVRSTYEFMHQYAEWQKTATKSRWFNPILDDYVNFKFFTS